jgi:hypothetical protein
VKTFLTQKVLQNLLNPVTFAANTLMASKTIATTCLKNA